MPTRKILFVGLFGIVAVMIITAAIHLVAAYVAAIIVLTVIFTVLVRTGTRQERAAPADTEPVEPKTSWLDWPPD